MTCDAYDVVVVPFPFTDSAKAKRRPALVLSAGDAFNRKAAHSVLAMITSRKNASWPLDVPIDDLEAAGLSTPSKVRMKLFTLDHTLIIEKRGRLGAADEREVRAAVARLLGWTPAAAAARLPETPSSGSGD